MTFRQLILLCSFFTATAAYAANRLQLFQWTPPDESVEGDLLDEDGDGVREMLAGYRLYLIAGTAPAEGDTLLWEVLDNTLTEYEARTKVPFGESCYYMTALGVPEVSVGDYMESAPSNVVCRTLEQGPPKPPSVSS